MLSLVRGSRLETIKKFLDCAPPGVGVEFGVYQGGTLLEMAQRQPWRMFYGFDTFEGLPGEAWQEGEPHGIGDFRDTDYKQIAASMPFNVILKPGLFPQTGEGIFDKVGFAHVDFDYELSTAAAIDWLKPRLVRGGVVVFDDYEWQHCPGVRRAIDASGIAILKSGEHQAYWTK